MCLVNWEKSVYADVPRSAGWLPAIPSFRMSAALLSGLTVTAVSHIRNPIFIFPTYYQNASGIPDSQELVRVLLFLKSNLSLWIAGKVCNCYNKVQTLTHCQHRWKGKIWIRALLSFWQKSVNKKTLSTRKDVGFTIKWLIILPSKWLRVVLNIAQLN